MTGIFKTNNPTNIFLLLLYAVFLKFSLFSTSMQPVVQVYDSILYKYLIIFFRPLANSVPFVYNLFTFTLLFSQAIYINKVVNAQHLFKQPHYLTAMSYLLITSLLSDWFLFSAALIVNTLGIAIYSRLCTLYNNPNAKATIFNIGLLTGLATFIYFPFFILLILVMIGIAIARPFKLQEWLTGLIGMLTPIYLFVVMLFITGELSKYKLPKVYLTLPYVMPNPWAMASIGTIILATVIGFFYTIKNMQRQVVLTRKSWQLLILYSIIAFISIYINAAKVFSNGIVLALPLAVLVASTFYYPKKRILPVLLHMAMLSIYMLNYFYK